MLAPRKTLWSTPSPAVDVALDFAQLDADDVVFDVGCGDGRVLVQMAARSVPMSAPLTEADSSEGDGSGAGGQQRHPADAASKPQYHRCHQFVGIEISPERAEEARNNIARARSEGKIPPHVSIEIICANALDTGLVDYGRATVVFLYLVPRGLRLIKDVVWPPAKEPETKEPAAELSEATTSDTTNGKELQLTAGKRPRRIITYMAPFENTKHVRKELCKVEHQEGAAWPVYLYHANV